MLAAATLFSGIGAPECAMPSWGWRWHAEIEKFPAAVLAARHPQSINLGDVNAEDFVARAERAGRPDVLIFGSPCQDFSVAGQRVGLDGDRGNLALVALGIARRLRPRWVVFENVPGLLSSYSGSAEAERALQDRVERGQAEPGEFADADEDSDFAAFLSLVQQCGYFGCYRITDAQFAGVPQRRRRVFAVFHLGDWRPAAAVLFEPESLRGDYPPSRTAWEGIAPTISARTKGGGGLGTDFDCDGGLIAGAVSSKWSKGTGGPAGDECYNLVAEPIPVLEAGARTGKSTDDIRAGMGVAQPALHSIQGRATVRRLTPVECERLQAFPDDWTLIKFRGKPAADGPRYKALGNAMNVAEIRWVLQRVELVDKLLQGDCDNPARRGSVVVPQGQEAQQ